MNQWIWLSHILDEDTPAYGGGGSLHVEPVKQICCGDSCNTLQFSMSNHLGSHVDAPRHFVQDGQTIDSYSPADWMFTKPLLIDLPVQDDQIIDSEFVEKHLKSTLGDADLILFRTELEPYRGEQRFWERAPGFAPDLREFLQARFPSLRAIGMNSISISSFQHREIGRAAHREFLGAGIMIFEDLMLAQIPSDKTLKQVTALPLRIRNADGAPATLIAELVDVT